jgi:hypothetical protein
MLIVALCRGMDFQAEWLTLPTKEKQLRIQPAVKVLKHLIGAEERKAADVSASEEPEEKLTPALAVEKWADAFARKGAEFAAFLPRSKSDPKALAAFIAAVEIGLAEASRKSKEAADKVEKKTTEQQAKAKAKIVIV